MSFGQIDDQLRLLQKTITENEKSTTNENGSGNQKVEFQANCRKMSLDFEFGEPCLCLCSDVILSHIDSLKREIDEIKRFHLPVGRDPDQPI